MSWDENMFAFSMCVPIFPAALLIINTSADFTGHCQSPPTKKTVLKIWLSFVA